MSVLNVVFTTQNDVNIQFNEFIFP